MEQEAGNRDLLIEYLLGKLNDDERQEQRELAERYFEDDALFDELLDAENELIELYVRGQLAPDERVAFAGYLDGLPDGREKAAFAAALMRAVKVNQAPSEPAPADLQIDEAPGRVSLSKSLISFMQRPHSALQYALAASIVLMAVGISWLVINNNGLRAGNDQLRDRLAQKETESDAQKQKVQELQRQTDERSARVEQLQSELERQRQPGNLTIPFASLVLTQPTTRDLFEPDTLTLNRSVKVASIAVPIKRNGRYVGYSAVLQTVGGDRIWQQEVKKTRALHLRESIVFGIDAGQLIQTVYKLTLTLVTEDGEEAPREYYFKVILR